MSQEDRIRAYLASLPPDSPELEYYTDVFQVLIALDVSWTEADGFACVMLLNESRIELVNGHILGDEDAFPSLGSIEDAAGAVAMMCGHINADPLWWKANYAVRRDEMDIVQRAVEIAELIKVLPMVSDLEVPKPPDEAAQDSLSDAVL